MSKLLSILKITPTTDLPNYLALKQRLSAAIHAGFWLPSEALPEYQELAELCKISVQDVETTYTQLATENKIFIKENKYFITPKIDQSLTKLTNLSQILQQKGFNPTTQWLSRTISDATDEEILSLNLTSKHQVCKLERLRLADDIIIGLEVSSIPTEIIADPLLIGDSLYAFLRSINVHPHKAEEYIEAVLIDELIAKKTGLEQGCPALHLIRTTSNAQGIPFELTHSYFRSDYYRFIVDLKI